MQYSAPRPLPAKPLGLYRTFWRFAAGNRRRVLLFMSLLILAQLLKLAIPYLSGEAVSAMQNAGDAALGTAGWDMALIFIVCAASWLLHGPARVIERFVAIRVHERFADTLYAKSVALRSTGISATIPARRSNMCRRPAARCSASPRTSSSICRTR